MCSSDLHIVLYGAVHDGMIYYALLDKRHKGRTGCFIYVHPIIYALYHIAVGFAGDGHLCTYDTQFFKKA